MDLRNLGTHLHYMHVIKKGTVVELMNQTPSGAPARKFRYLSEIYNDGDSLRERSLAGRNYGNISRDLVGDGSEGGLRILIGSAGDSLWHDPFSEEAEGVNSTDDSSSDDSSDDSSSDDSPDDSGSDELTLQQLRELHREKGKKRKSPESGFGSETSSIGREHSESQSSDDLSDSDLSLPLSSFLPGLRNKKRASIVERPEVLSPSLETTFDSDNYGDVNLENNENSKSASPVCPSHSDNVDETEKLASETPYSSQGPERMHDELDDSFEHFTTYSPCVLTTHMEAIDLPVLKLKLQDDGSATPSSGVWSDTVSPVLGLALASQNVDRSEPQCSTNEIISRTGNDPLNYPSTMIANVEAEIMAVSGVYNESDQQLSPSTLKLSEQDAQKSIHVTPLLVTSTNSTVHVADKHDDFEPHSIENGIDSPVTYNLVKSDLDNENMSNIVRNLPSFQSGSSHLHVLEVNVQENTSTGSLFEVPSNDLTSTVEHMSDIDDPMDINDNSSMNAARNNPVNQKTDDLLVASFGHEVNIMEDDLHTIKENVEGAQTSYSGDNVITNSADEVSQSANFLLLSYSDNTVPTNNTERDDTLLTITSHTNTETINITPTGAGSSINKTVGQEAHQQSRPSAPPESSSSKTENKLWKAMENMDIIDSREKLRSLGKLVSENQIKQKKQSTMKGKEIKRPEQIDKSTTSKNSESKKSDSAHEKKDSDAKTHHPSSLKREKRKGKAIGSSPKGAIQFSKRQMQDFEALARELTKEIVSMKKIVRDGLNQEASTSGQTGDQVITAITKKAAKAERKAKHTLSRLNRDCFRFRRIMESTSSKTVIPNKERKVQFADEQPGGELFQIIIYHDESDDKSEGEGGGEGEGDGRGEGEGEDSPPES